MSPSSRPLLYLGNPAPLDGEDENESHEPKGFFQRPPMSPFLAPRPLRFFKLPFLSVAVVLLFILGFAVYRSPLSGVPAAPAGDILLNPSEPKQSDRPLILYAYKETPNAQKNALFFINHGLHAAADFIFIINGRSNLTDSIPSKSNIRIINRPDKCFDMGAYGEVLSAKDNELVKKYNKFILINASIRGPFMPTWSRDCWSDAYLARITDTNKLVGMTYNCQPSHKLPAHVQSMILATDRVGMNLLLPVLSECPNTHMAAVRAEGNCTRAIVDGGYNVTAFMTSFSSREDYAKACKHADVLSTAGYYGTEVHPYETIFAKANRNYGKKTLQLLTDWSDAAGYSSWEVCGKGRDELSALGGWGRWKEAAAAVAAAAAAKVGA